jgi:DNA-binding SARP family transcriptional activator
MTSLGVAVKDARVARPPDSWQTRFQLLGPLSIANHEGSLALPSSRPVNLLAALLMHPNSVVSLEFLARAVWGEDEPEVPKCALQTCVTRLRKTLVSNGITDNVIESVPGGYRMGATTSTLDLLDFRARVAAAARVDDPAQQIDVLRGALSLWREAVLCNVQSDMLHLTVVPQLTEQRLAVIERVIDLQIGQGNLRGALSDLWATTRFYQGNERFAEQLITTLFHSGRRQEALQEFQRTSAYLKDDLGLDPGPRLQALHMSILRGDADEASPRPPSSPAVDVWPPDDTDRVVEGIVVPFPIHAAVPPVVLVEELRFADQVTVISTQDGVKVPPIARAATGFVGRELDIAAVKERLLVDNGTSIGVLCGFPGIGKSALAAKIAESVCEHFPDGQIHVNLTDWYGAERSHADVLHDVGAQLGALPNGGTIHDLRRSGASARVLVVLDDARRTEQVSSLLLSGIGGAVLVTSRSSLGGLVVQHGAWIYRVGPLSPDSARALLARSLGAERANAEPDAVREIGKRCAHHPLALRTVAARLQMRPGLSLAECASWIGDNTLYKLSSGSETGLAITDLLAGAIGRLEPGLRNATLRIARHTDSVVTVQTAAQLLVHLNAYDVEATLEALTDAGVLDESEPGAFEVPEVLRLYSHSVAVPAIGISEAINPPTKKTECA